MGSDISGEGSNDNTIEQNLQGAKKLAVVKATKNSHGFMLHHINVAISNAIQIGIYSQNGYSSFSQTQGTLYL